VKQRIQQLGMTAAVETLTVVLQGEFPIAVLDQVNLLGDLRER
jgi:hypothetical protein